MDKITSSLSAPSSEYDETVNVIRQRIDNVRMNLGAELAELRQRRAVAKKNLTELWQSGQRIINACMAVYSVFTTIRGILSFFQKGERAQKERREVLKGFAVQAGVYAAQKAFEKYKAKQALAPTVANEQLLLTDSQKKRGGLELRQSDAIELMQPPAVPVCSVDYSKPRVGEVFNPPPQ